jgi:hypothetical protein
LNVQLEEVNVSDDKRPVSIQTVSVGDDTADPSIKKRVDRYLRGKQARRDEAVGDLAFCHLQTGLPPLELVERVESLLNGPKRNLSDIPGSEHWPPDTCATMTRSFLNLRAATLGIRANKVYAFDKAVRFEALCPVDPTGVNPSEAKIKHIAEEASVRRKTIRNWRKTQVYKKAVLTDRFALKVFADNKKNAATTSGDL